MRLMIKSLQAGLIGLGLNLLVTPAANAHNPQDFRQNQEQSNAHKSVFSVSATAEVTQNPDHIEIIAAVISRGKDAQDTGQDNAQKMSTVFASLSQLGITEKNIKTINISLEPRFDYSQKRRPRILGYEAENRIAITHDNPKQAGDIVERLITAGVNDIDDVRFYIKDAESLQDMATDTAIKKARKKAAAIAASAGVSLGKLHGIKIDGNNQNGQNYDQIVVTASRKKGGDDDNYIPPISHGEQTITARVTLTYELP